MYFFYAVAFSKVLFLAVLTCFNVFNTSRKNAYREKFPLKTFVHCAFSKLDVIIVLPLIEPFSVITVLSLIPSKIAAFVWCNC